MNELDEIMSDNGNAVSEVQTEQPSQTRDESGRFASATPEPVVTDTPVVEGHVQKEAHQQGGIPQQRLKAEADKRREAEASAEALRREIAELRGMVQAGTQPKPQQATQQERPPVTIWDNPEEFLSSQLSPVQQQMQEMREMLWESQAAGKHGADKIEAAKTAAAALAGTPEGRALHQQITSKGNPFDNLVDWHQKQQVMSRVGNDPEAWLEAELEKRLSDPAEQAKIMERMRQGATANTSRSQPLTSLPPSLSRLPSGGNQAADNDASDGALFSHAMR